MSYTILEMMQVSSAIGIDGLLHLRHIAARDRYELMAVLDEQLHGARLGNNLFHLLQIYQESTVATNHHGIVAQILLYLFGRSAEHV